VTAAAFLAFADERIFTGSLFVATRYDDASESPV